MSSTQTKIKSISNRVTVWYSIFFILLSAILLIGFYLVSDFNITQSAQKQLETSVVDSVDDFAEGDFEANDNGVYLSRYNASGQLIEGAVPIPSAETFTHGKLSETVVEEARYLYYDYYDNQSKVWFRGILSVQQNDRIIHNLLTIMMITLPIVVILVLGGGYWIIRRALKPIKTMSETTQQIAQKLDLSQRVDLGQGQSELDLLAQAFNHMLDRVQDSYERERQFTSDVSHELRTPIAVIKSETEYAKSQPQLSDSLTTSLDVIHRQTKQMTKLVTSLLDMTRMEHQSQIDKMPIAFSQLLLDQVDNYAIICEAEGKQLTSDISENLIIAGDSQLLKRLVDNLLSNAVKFSQKQIWISALQKDMGVSLTISNDGPGIPAEELDKIWQRMYQGDKSRHQGGLGLGLSFVKRIADLHQVTIKMTSQDNLTTFELFFPSSS